VSPLETIARLLPLLPGSDRSKAAQLGVTPQVLCAWLAEYEGTAKPPVEGRAGRRRYRAPNAADVERIVGLLREHGADVGAALAGL
jgi:DNA-binding transcriptional MerR regulator